MEQLLCMFILNMISFFSFRKDVSGNHTIQSFYHDVVQLQVVSQQLRPILLSYFFMLCLPYPIFRKLIIEFMMKGHLSI